MEIERVRGPGSGEEAIDTVGGESEGKESGRQTGTSRCRRLVTICFKMCLFCFKLT